MKKVKRFIAVMVSTVMLLMLAAYFPVSAVTSADLTISQNGIEFICSLEGFHSTCYSDYSQSSIGFGTKCNGSSVQPHASGLHSITREQAMIDMKAEIENSYIPNVRRQTSGISMNQNQFDALVSLTYNCGGGTTLIKNSPLVKYLRGELSESEARSQYSSYIVTAGGKVLQGLINRRNKEADLFFSGVDNEPPVISSVSITDISTSGYTVSCIVTDNNGISKVQFPTWTNKDDQDDIIWHNAAVNGNIYTYRVNISEHNNELGAYTTHIYAWDTSGNASSASAGTIVIENDKPIISNIGITDVSVNGYTVVCEVVDNGSGLNRVQFPTWTVNNGQDDIIWGTGTANGNTYTYRVNVSDHNNELGQYYTHIYAYDNCGNVSSEYAIDENVYSENPNTGQGVYLENVAPTISDVEIIDITPTSYTVRCIVKDDKSGISRVQFPTWTTENDQDDIQASWETNPKASGILNGNVATYTVYTSDHNNEKGPYATHIYAYDRNGNCNCYGGLPCITLYDYADLNQDGSVTILDAVLLQKHLLNFKKLTTEQMKLADINSDGRVNILDMSLLKEKLK